jgi:SAM-dependent methyltransferase
MELEAERFFNCNICGKHNSLQGKVRHRELYFCDDCGSCARFRGVVLAVQRFVLADEAKPLKAQKTRMSVRAIGMSDSLSYAPHLERLFSYTNTYYHMEPFVDVTNKENCDHYRDLDFIICSEVLEHVRTPVVNCLQNMHSMLKSGGKLILTTPYLSGYETVEHYPHLHDYKIFEHSGRYIVSNIRKDGLHEFHQSPSFHGGPGEVLEMRVFGEGDLMAMIRQAGFSRIDDLEPTSPGVGYDWDEFSFGALYPDRKLKAHVLVCTK